MKTDTEEYCEPGEVALYDEQCVRAGQVHIGITTKEEPINGDVIVMDADYARFYLGLEKSKQTDFLARCARTVLKYLGESDDSLCNESH